MIYFFTPETGSFFCATGVSVAGLEVSALQALTVREMIRKRKTARIDRRFRLKFLLLRIPFIVIF